MIEIRVPQLDVNSESATLVEWHLADGTAVHKGQVICTVETTKSVLDLAAESDGLLVRVGMAGREVPFGEVIGFIVADAAEAERVRASQKKQTKPSVPAGSVRASKKAVQFARQHNVDLEQIGKRGIITADDVRDYLVGRAILPRGKTFPGESPDELLDEMAEVWSADTRSSRVLVITAGVGAMQVIDILLNDPCVSIVGCVDDDAALTGRKVMGAEVIGKLSDIEMMWRDKRFDSAIVACSAKIPLRKRFFKDCVALGIPMINAIDPTVRINRNCVLGSGNVICSQVHIGVASKIGDNNFISAKTNIDHHNVWGSHITTGPNCVLSSLINVGDEVKFGTGIFVQPHVRIGMGSVIGSGAVILDSVPERHAVKVKIQTKIIPL